MKYRKCKFCGKEFIPNSNRQIYCKGPHYMDCPVCGKQYEVTNVENLKRPAVACSYECRVKKTQETSMSKYGCRAPGNNPEARKKAIQTMVYQYGVAYTLQSKELRDKVESTNLKRYGCKNAGSNPAVIKKRVKTTLEKYDGVFPFNSEECYKKQQAETRRISKTNLRFAAKLDALNIPYEFEYYLKGKSYDFHILNSPILVEIDPTYTHSPIPTHWGTAVSKDYHWNKSCLARDNGFHCIHVFDEDDPDKITAMLSPRIPIFARRCTIYKLNQDVAVEFLDKYDLKGSARGQLLCLGLVYDYELVQVMTFGKSKHNKNYYEEVLRVCTKPGYRVIGGASKLFHFAVEEYEMHSVVAYCDCSKFSGEMYEKMGMDFLHHNPAKLIWTKDGQVVKEKSSIKTMLLNDCVPHYTCGVNVYEFRY